MHYFEVPLGGNSASGKHRYGDLGFEVTMLRRLLNNNARFSAVLLHSQHNYQQKVCC